ncbi:MAG: DUF362 domain-containing protein [Chloroflexota bacterium]|nr:DUF362 domain-containing protein [Chloroflexota bacterium]
MINSIDKSKFGKVFILKTSPQFVIGDYANLLSLSEINKNFNLDTKTLLKANISWQHYFPACSTAPWQLDGVIRGLKSLNFKDIEIAHNGTVVVNAHEGKKNNGYEAIEENLSVKSSVLDDPGQEWIHYKPKQKMIALDKIYPDGINIPKKLLGTNIVHLPTVKTHVFTTITGAMKNAFGGLLHQNRHWAHSDIHNTLVDLLKIQYEIHDNVFAVMDGTFAGNGPGPRAMSFKVKNYILASYDQVAIDSISAKLMGFDPLSIPKLRIAHENGLGIANPSEINIIGDSISNQNWNFHKNKNTFASRIQKMIYWGPFKPLEKILLRTPLVHLAYFASNLYHNSFWLRVIGKSRIRSAFNTDWGQLLNNYKIIKP